MKLIYTGSHDEVVVGLPLGGEAVVARGDEFSTSDKHAASLLEQPQNWRMADKKVSAKSPSNQAEEKAEEPSSPPKDN